MNTRQLFHFDIASDLAAHRSVWVIALPALIVGPVTYLVTVALLMLRIGQNKKRAAT